MKITKAKLKQIIKEELDDWKSRPNVAFKRISDMPLNADGYTIASVDLEEKFLKDLMGVRTALQNVINEHITDTDSDHVRDDVAETLHRMVEPLSDLIADVRGTTLPSKTPPV